MFLFKSTDKRENRTVSIEQDKEEASAYKDKLETEMMPAYAAHSENATTGLELIMQINTA